MKNKLGLTLLFLSLFTVFSCNPTDEPSGDQFDRRLMLQNFAENLIVPDFAQATQKSADLLEILQGLQQNTGSTQLRNAQLAWQEAYRAYLKISMYNFGPAGEEVIRKSLVEEVATFPISIARISAKTQTATPNFNDFERDSRGFLALDYLLFRMGAIDNISKDPLYIDYTIKVAEDINKRIREANEFWKTYQTEFIANDGTDAGSSTSALYNEFVKSYEGLKNFKIGLPLGIRPGQTQAEPEKVEALYSGLSLSFLKTQFEAIVNVWKGGNALGFDDYLEKVEGGSTLVISTKEQIAVIENELNQFPENAALSELIQANESQVVSLHTELQKNTRFFKSELSSLLGIAITFTSGDGD